jgi:hypothetical protein
MASIEMPTRERTFTVADFIAELWMEDDYYDQICYTKHDLAHMAWDAIDALGRFRCFGCDRDTGKMGEYYLIHDTLWKAHGVEGMLCIGCFEARLGRRLTPADFTDCNVNNDDDENDYKSDRLRDRLGRPLNAAEPKPEGR